MNERMDEIGVYHTLLMAYAVFAPSPSLQSFSPRHCLTGGAIFALPKLFRVPSYRPMTTMIHSTYNGAILFILLPYIVM